MTRTIIGRIPKRKHTKFSGSVTVPASKSHTIRGLLIAAFAEGESRLIQPLLSRDSLSCCRAVEALGAGIVVDNDDWIVSGVGAVPKLRNPHIRVGNSGTTLYLASALSALGTQPVVFDGDDQIRARSATPLLNALRMLGARIISYQNQDGCAPFEVTGPLSPGIVEIDCPVSQYLSGLLLAAPLISSDIPDSRTRIIIRTLNEAPYVDMTLDWLEFQGIQYTRKNWDWFEVPAGQKYINFKRKIPGDWSSATFFLTAAAVTGGTINIIGLDLQDSQGDKAVLEMFAQLGCEWEKVPGGVKLIGRPLIGTELNLNATPDALPAMAVAACFAKGETRLVNVPQARMKETDRIAVMTAELSKLGADVEERADGMLIRGCRNGTPLQGTVVDGHGDHRVVMALAIAALGTCGAVTIEGSEAAEITYPDFFNVLEKVIEEC